MKNMKIENVSQTETSVTVETTGAQFILTERAGKGVLICRQLIGVERDVCTLTLSRPLSRVTIEEQNEDFCLLHCTSPAQCGAITIRIHGDSHVSFKTNHKLKAWCEIVFKPEYLSFTDGHGLLIDEHGGVGLYALGPNRPGFTAGLLAGKHQVGYDLNKSQNLWLSVFPPKAWDAQLAQEARIVHHADSNRPYPTAADMKSWRPYGNLLVIHSTIWRGKHETDSPKPYANTRDCYEQAPFARFHHVIRDQEAFRRMLDEAHALDFKVLPYSHPFDYPGTDEEFLSDMEEFLKAFPLDGLYYDGVSADIESAYKIMSKTRRMLGDKLLYVHCPSPILGDIDLAYFKGYYGYCPFIDAYADLMLRGEHLNAVNEGNLRYTVSGRNISNTPGFLCTYDYDPELVRRSMDAILNTQVRLPYFTGYWVGGEQIDNERETGDNKEARHQAVMREAYFPKLDREG